MSIEIRNITKRFNGYQALGNVDLTVPSGELVALLGLVTLVAKSVVEWRQAREAAPGTGGA